MKKVFVYLAMLLQNSIACAQQNDYGKVWVQGAFRIYTSTFDGIDVTNDVFAISPNLVFALGHSNISDSTGSLKLISDGFRIFDAQTDTIVNGGQIVQNEMFNTAISNFYAQSSIFLPLAKNMYILINASASDYEINTYWKQPSTGRALFDLLFYNLIDMDAHNGQGAVVRKMHPLLQGVELSKSQMMATRHGDGKSWWLLKQASDTNMVYKFLITADSIYGPFVQGFHAPRFSRNDLGGQSMFSQDGTLYATTCRGAGKIFVADFDRCSGDLSNPRVFDLPAYTFINPWDNTPIVDSFSEGLCFSPNGRFIYVSSYYHIHQLDLQDNDPNTRWYKVADLDTTIDFFQSYSSLALAPNNKVYIGNWAGFSGQMSAINEPDEKGAACEFCPRCLRFPKYQFQSVGVTQPPCMPNYKLGATNPPCWPMGITPVEKEIPIRIYPNPANDMVHIEYAEPGLLELIDLTGRVYRSIRLEEQMGSYTVDIRDAVPGLYIYRWLVDGQPKENGKLMIGR